MKYTYKYLEDRWCQEYWNFLQNNKNKYESSYNILSNPNITWNILKDNFNGGLNWCDISDNPNISWDIIRTNPDKIGIGEGSQQIQI